MLSESFWGETLFEDGFATLIGEFNFEEGTVACWDGAIRYQTPLMFPFVDLELVGRASSPAKSEMV